MSLEAELWVKAYREDLQEWKDAYREEAKLSSLKDKMIEDLKSRVRFLEGIIGEL